MKRNTFSTIPCIGIATSHYKEELIQELTLRRLSKLGGNRYPLLVCSECGDVDCGYISAIIEEENNTIIWRAFMKSEETLSRPLLFREE